MTSKEIIQFFFLFFFLWWCILSHYFSIYNNNYSNETFAGKNKLTTNKKPNASQLFLVVVVVVDVVVVVVVLVVCLVRNIYKFIFVPMVNEITFFSGYFFLESQQKYVFSANRPKPRFTKRYITLGFIHQQKCFLFLMKNQLFM